MSQGKHQKHNQCTTIVSCKYLSFDQSGRSNSCLLIELQNGEFRVLSQNWDKLSNPVFIGDLSYFTPCDLLVSDSYMYVSSEKIENAKRIMSVDLLLNLLRFIVESKTTSPGFKNHEQWFGSWLMAGIPFKQVLEPIFKNSLQTTIIGENLLRKLHNSDFNSFENFESTCFCVLTFLKYTKLPLSESFQLGNQWSIVKEILSWKGIYKDAAQHPQIVKLFGMERKIIILLLCARRYDTVCGFNKLPLDILRYHFIPLICWSLPFKTPFLF